LFLNAWRLAKQVRRTGLSQHELACPQRALAGEQRSITLSESSILPSSFAVTCVRSAERDGIAAPNRPAGDHVAIDPHIRLIVLRCGTKNAGIPWQVALRQGGHHASRATTGDPQADLVADRDGAVDPVVLHE